jgi:hypothetical protein
MGERIENMACAHDIDPTEETRMAIRFDITGEKLRNPASERTNDRTMKAREKLN